MDEALLRRLHDPACYPDRPDSVEVVQTHISVVCITDTRVYKLKKPVRLSFVDFSTAALRERGCRDELRLNRRLCPDLYLDVVPLYSGAGGASFVPPGEVVDHAVLMHRLPAARMMDAMLERGAVAVEHVEELARMLARFHAQHVVRPEKGAPGHPALLAEFVRANFTETASLGGDLFDPALHTALARRADRDLARHGPHLLQRVASGHVVDGHGDLHARNICLTDPPSIYDCLEFSPDLRCGDTAVETGFLVMDLLRVDRADLAEAFVRAYVEASGDERHRELLPLAVAYRAMVRAKVAALTSLDADVGADTCAAARAEVRSLTALAARVACEADGAALIIACGLPGSGKSYVLEGLAAATGWTVFSSDRIRKELAGIDVAAPAPPSAYTPEAKQRVYAELLDRARVACGNAARPVLLDATFETQSIRAQAQAVADALGVRLWTVHLQVEGSTARDRIRSRGNDSGSDADEAVYERAKTRFEPPTDATGVLHLDASKPRATLVDEILAAMV